MKFCPLGISDGTPGGIVLSRRLMQLKRYAFITMPPYSLVKKKNYAVLHEVVPVPVSEMPEHIGITALSVKR